MTLTLLLCGAVPIGTEKPPLPNRKGSSREEFINTLAWETIQMILTPTTPPNSPTATAQASTFTFPASPQEVSTRLQQKPRKSTKTVTAASSSPLPAKLSDGNDADESEAEDQPEVRRKRVRVSSFSGAAPNLRRVPHKKKKDVVAPATSSADDKAAVASVDTTDMSRLSYQDPEVWRRIGTELKTIAAKFSRNGGDSGTVVTTGGKRFGGGGEMSKNVVTIAINILIWKLMKRLMS